MRLELLHHPDTPPADPNMAIEVWLDRWEDGGLELSFHLHADTNRIVIPKEPRRGPADELWKTTCFEFFARTDKGYQEYNFAPSGAWAAYGFDGYRAGMRPLVLDREPQIDAEATGDELVLDVVIDWAGEGHFGLSAVIEEQDGTKSYWALAHPSGKPDFHHDACFAATLPAMSAE